MKVVTVVGARPQFVKASVVSRALRDRSGCEEVVVHTGQHYDANMSQVFFEELGIPEPAYNLAIGSGPHGQQTGRMLESIERVLSQEHPDIVLVYGDTNSTLAGALAAAKLQLPVAHVEAGLRSFNRAMPEELNRVVTDHLSSLLFAPTNVSRENLLREGIEERSIHLTGDVMFDAAIYFSARAEAQSAILESLGQRDRGYVLCTIHRAENTDNPERLAAIFETLAAIARQTAVVLPLHPRTRATLAGFPGSWLSCLTVIDPAGYLDMLVLERHARCVLTDSGGVQKEAFFQNVPCVTLRDETEWVELVECGWNVLASPALGSPAMLAIIERQMARDPGPRPELYGWGNAGGVIAEILAGVARKAVKAIPGKG